MINKLAKEVHQNAKNKGFFDSKKNIGEMLCLIHSEVSEALEADRKNMYTNLSEELREDLELDGTSPRYDTLHFESFVKDTFEDELADVMIRVMDLAAFKNIDLEWHIKQKMNYNSKREHKHGKNY
jgi:NTP pyrophosphatase (non-canonical NTP hydrolase)